MKRPATSCQRAFDAGGIPGFHPCDQAGQENRASEEAELARRRFMQVHPDNRLVADTLEGDWNGKLHALATVVV